MWALHTRFPEFLDVRVLSHAVLSSLNHLKCLSIAQDVPTSEDLQNVSGSTSKTEAFETANH